MEEDNEIQGAPGKLIANGRNGGDWKLVTDIRLANPRLILRLRCAGIDNTGAVVRNSQSKKSIQNGIVICAITRIGSNCLA